MPVSTQYNCVFVHIPKTGGTSIEKALGLFGEWQKEDKKKLFGLIQSVNLIEKNYLSNFLQHLSLQEIIQQQPIVKDYYTFSFVRNPWDRMVSIYHNTDINLCIEASNLGIDLSDLSFQDFLIALRKIKHIHLEEQWKFLYDANLNVQVDFIGRFENIPTRNCNVVFAMIIWIYSKVGNSTGGGCRANASKFKPTH
jgi:hypothetical protein